ncbi:PR domain zinc finger protein 15, partial [Gryllus bimaculatus]
MFDDSNLWCDDCGNSNSGECNKHGVLHVVSDLPFVSRARQTLPSILELKSPTDSEEGLLVFSRAWIQRRTRFGPLQAPTRKQRPSFSLQIEQLTQRPTLPFKLFRSSASGVGKELSALWLNADESRNEELSNWMVFVAVARTAKEQNLVAFQYQSGIYFVTIKDIAVGEELRVWYAKEYAACMGIAPLPKASARIKFTVNGQPKSQRAKNGITSIRKIIKAVKDIIEAELSSTIHYLLLILLNDRLLTWFDERNKESNLRKFNQIDSNIFCVLIGDVINRSCSLVPHKNIIDFLNCLLTLHCLYIYFFNFILFIFFWKMYHAFKQLGFLCPNETNIFLYCLGFFIMRGTSYSSSCLSFLQNFNSVFEGIVLERKKIISIAICSFGYVFQMVFIQRCMSDIKYLLFFHLVALSCSSSLSILFSFSSLLIFIFSTNIPKINLFNIVTCYNSADFAIIVLVKPSSYVFNDTLRNFFVVKSAQVCAMVCTRRNNYPFFEIVIHKTVLAKIIFMKRQTVDRKKLLLEQGKKIYNLRSALNIFVLR